MRVGWLSTGRDQAACNLLADVVARAQRDEVPLDIGAVFSDRVRGEAPESDRFLDLVEGEVGVTPMIYTSFRFWNAHLGPGFERYPLWVAEYGVDQPTLPAAWSRWHLWQYEGNAPVPGIEKGADRSRLHPEVDLAALVVPAPPAP